MNQEPRLIYGTAWKEEDTERLTRLAIETGFRAIDTANQRKHYFEAAVGDAVASAIRDGTVGRDALFLQTKFTYQEGQDHRLPYDPKSSYERQVLDSFESSLEHLQVDALDSYVLHGPKTRQGLTDADRQVWQTMEGLLDDGRVGAIGVSNVSAEQLETLLQMAARPVSFVQNRCFARDAWDLGVREICETHDIVYQGFSLLTANRGALESEPIREIARRHDKTVPQVIFRFAVEVGMLPLTGTTDPNHMKQDLAITDFELRAEEVSTIEQIAFV